MFTYVELATFFGQAFYLVLKSCGYLLTFILNVNDTFVMTFVYDCQWYLYPMSLTFYRMSLTFFKIPLTFFIWVPCTASYMFLTYNLIIIKIIHWVQNAFLLGFWPSVWLFFLFIELHFFSLFAWPRMLI